MSKVLEVLPGDATSLVAQREAVDALVARFGQLDATFANAGVGMPRTSPPP